MCIFRPKIPKATPLPPPPTVKPTVGASTQTLKDHVQNKQNTGTTTPAPPA